MRHRNSASPYAAAHSRRTKKARDGVLRASNAAGGRDNISRRAAAAKALDAAQRATVAADSRFTDADIRVSEFGTRIGMAGIPREQTEDEVLSRAQYEYSRASSAALKAWGRVGDARRHHEKVLKRCALIYASAPSDDDASHDVASDGDASAPASSPIHDAEMALLKAVDNLRARSEEAVRAAWSALDQARENRLVRIQTYYDALRNANETYLSTGVVEANAAQDHALQRDVTSAQIARYYALCRDSNSAEMAHLQAEREEQIAMATYDAAALRGK